MHKTTFALVTFLALAAASAFAAGGQEAARGGKVSLTMYTWYDLSDPVVAQNWGYFRKAFQAQYPQIDLLIEYGSGNAYHDKLQAKVAANQINDIVLLWPDKISAYITGTGKMMDLTARLKGHEKEFVPGALAPQLGGKAIWEVPEKVTDCHVMYTNTKLLKQLGLAFPKTLDELLAQAPKILDAGLIPIAMDDKDGWQVQSCLLGALIGRTGGNAWFDKALSGKGGSFTDAAFVDALTVIEQLAKAQMFSPGIVQNNYGTAGGDFFAEKAVYTIDGDWIDLNDNLRPEQYSDIDLNTFPDLPAAMQHGVSGATAQVTGTGYGMRGDLTGAKADAAWAWIWFRSGPVGSAIRQGFGAVPAYIMPPRADLKLPIQKLMSFLARTPGVYVVDSVMSQDAMAQLQPALQELILGRKTPQQIAEEFEVWVAKNEPSRK